MVEVDADPEDTHFERASNENEDVCGEELVSAEGLIHSVVLPTKEAASVASKRKCGPDSRKFLTRDGSHRRSVAGRSWRKTYVADEEREEVGSKSGVDSGGGPTRGKYPSVTSGRRSSSFLWKIFSPTHRDTLEKKKAPTLPRRLNYLRCGLGAPAAHRVGAEPMLDRCMLSLQVEPLLSNKALLPPKDPRLLKKITAVIDLDETMVHSSFYKLPIYDFTVHVTIGGERRPIYVRKRPGVDRFLKAVSEWFELVVFTASLPMYANPVCDLLEESSGCEIHGRLFRQHCVVLNNMYVKDLRRIGRSLSRTVIVDNSEISFCLQPENAIYVTDFTNNSRDKELGKLLRLLHRVKDHPGDIRHGGGGRV